MEAIQRKRFLQVVAGAGLAAANFLYPGLTRAGSAAASGPLTSSAPPPNIISVEGPDPAFASGEVVSKTSEGLVLRSPIGVRAVRVPAGTSVWKEHDVGIGAVQIGDWVDLRGTPMNDGTIVARSGWIWVNIGRLDGVVEVVNPGAVAIRDNRGRRRAMELSSRLEVIRAEDESPLPGHVAALKPGHHIGAVGLRLADGGFRATRIWRNDS